MDGPSDLLLQETDGGQAGVAVMIVGISCGNPGTQPNVCLQLSDLVRESW